MSPGGITDAMERTTAAPVAPTLWPEGDEMIVKAFHFVAAKYQELPSPRPAVVGQDWATREAAIEQAYAALDHQELLDALRAWAHFALSEFKRRPASV